MAERWSREDRGKRRFNVAQDDQRSPFERDRDRILYCSAFRRLAGVTQVVRAGESDVFHTRLTHTIKVSQLGRRLAQICLSRTPEYCEYYGVEPEVVEASCLAHDLGHPPFGHVGEHLLDKMVKKYHDDEGFEGNAQSFRVITKLSVRFEQCQGLDLTRASLSACLKYPWYRDKEGPRSIKFGCYKSESDEYAFAKEHWKEERKTAEAELMDWADDIAYSVHDLEDFHRCQAIPWHRILDEKDDLIANAERSWHQAPADAQGRLRSALRNLSSFMNLVPQLRDPYEATREQRRQLRLLTSSLIGRYINAIELVDPAHDNIEKSCVNISSDEQDQVRVLKQITRDYIIKNPSLSAQQKGQMRILEDLFNDLYSDIDGRLPSYLPRKFEHFLDDVNVSRARIVADCISSLTEHETIALHARLRGHSSGSVLDPIVR